MKIFFQIGVAVMVAVMRSPPEDTFLRRGHGHPGEDELEEATSFERTVRKIAMVAGGNEEHTHFVGEETGKQVSPLKMNEKDAKRRKMKEYKRDTRDELKPCSVGQGDGQGCCGCCHAA
jgi:hypothetical protein